ncbi:hypothetical protein [Virgibacillus dokdonensis]|uniref:FtsX-like permease family protein n=1 Tax=Virgibacillus dokdonensis TaxID=302167 RepID=A0A2K9J442_9BACI|nr:hypothetical protein [Virgibacillus dokdonensis]AUJ23760.1 hypothetical protein A21D_00647 [Virgibacillus dokdonensis]
MIRLSWQSVKNKTRSSFLLFGSLLAIFVAGPISIATLFDIQTEVKGNIESHARGTYDILVRPKDAQTEVEKEIGKVEENYLNYGDGGITLQQWEQMKDLEEVEIAAPVASLGYFTGDNKTFSFEFPTSSSYLELYFKTSDGINDYRITQGSSYYYMLKQNGYYTDDFDFIRKPGAESIYEGMRPEFTLPFTYYLTVGVDREQEEKLTGLDLSAMDNSITQEYQRIARQDSADRNISLIYLEDAFTPLTAHVTKATLNWSSAQTIQLKKELGLPEDQAFFFSDQYDHLSKRMQEVAYTDKEEFEIDLSNHIQPFYYKPFKYHYDGNFSESFNYLFGLSETPLFYRTHPIDYTILEQDALKVVQVGKHTGVPTYREIEKVGKSTRFSHNDSPFMLIPVGTFTTKEFQQTLAASPLGMYQQSPTTTLHEGKNVRETITPGSFISSPAYGIIDLEDAAYIKGDSPIDAIRVKVSDISAYNQAAIDKIRRTVGHISEIGDFHITVVAGASHSPVTLDVEGIGKVEQMWTTLGAATTIAEGWNTTNILIASMFSMISILYIMNHFLFRNRTQLEERQLLYDIGWTKKAIQRFHLSESGLVASLACLFGGIILLICYFLQFIQPVAWVAFSLFVLCTFIIMLGCSKRFKKQKHRTWNSNKLKRVWMRNLAFYKNLISLSFLQLVFVTLLVNFVPAVLYVTNQTTGETHLGTYINELVFLLMIIILGATFYVALTTIMESISSTLLLRRDEIITLRDIGWRSKDVRLTIMKESFAWMLPAFMLGMTCSITLLFVLFTPSINVVYISLITSGCFSLISVGVAYVIVKQTLKQIATS